MFRSKHGNEMIFINPTPKVFERKKDPKPNNDLFRSGYDVQNEAFKAKLKESEARRRPAFKYDGYKDLYVIRRTRGRNRYFRNGHDIMRLPVAGLKILSRYDHNSAQRI
ncbi:hypothetical protein L1987_52919 [Smallanthus sonchifolius]|uniref:Uncharacterized protein n=1 Tax=Smallanthus sonchifolius TaxID=185202 RepID=A0ACB9ETY7_9ASTR|nr:hypothetical protein L1987_52919 [Smallanthus sonchifolius]